MTILDKLAARNTKRLEVTASMSDAATNTYIGTATSDSTDGIVAVVMSNDAAHPEWYDGNAQEVVLPTTTSVNSGDTVMVSTFGGSVLSTPVVTGVVGKGDAMQEAINATQQYFWTDSNGIHVTQVPQDDWTDPTSPDYQSGPNVLLNSLGMVFRSGMTALASFTTSAVEFFTTAGTSVASFGSSLVRIGQTSGTHVEVDSTGFRVISGGETPLDASVVGGSGVINGDNMELTDSLTVNNTGQFIGGILAGTTADSEYIQHIRWGTGNAVTNSNGITTFNPGMGVKPLTVVVVMQHNAETEAIAKIAVPMVWSIDSATQVQVRWKRTDTNAWLTSNRVCWTWLAIA